MIAGPTSIWSGQLFRLYVFVSFVASAHPRYLTLFLVSLPFQLFVPPRSSPANAHTTLGPSLADNRDICNAGVNLLIHTDDQTIPQAQSGLCNAPRHFVSGIHTRRSERDDQTLQCISSPSTASTRTWTKNRAALVAAQNAWLKAPDKVLARFAVGPNCLRQVCLFFSAGVQLASRVIRRISHPTSAIESVCNVACFAAPKRSMAPLHARPFATEGCPYLGSFKQLGGAYRAMAWNSTVRRSAAIGGLRMQCQGFFFFFCPACARTGTYPGHSAAVGQLYAVSVQPESRKEIAWTRQKRARARSICGKPLA